MSISEHVYNRGLHCRPNIPPVYTNIINRKQRQGNLSLFSRCLMWEYSSLAKNYAHISSNRAAMSYWKILI